MRIAVNPINCPESYSATRIEISNKTVFMYNKDILIRTIQLQDDDDLVIV